METNELLNICARDLPEGYSIEIQVERHGGIVILLGPNGAREDFPSNDETPEQSVLDALECAKELVR